VARTWSVSVSLSAADITARLTGPIEIRAEENQARTATLSFLPAAGSYDPEDWIGAAVTIDHVADPDGTPVSTRVFTGYVNWPDLDETRSVLTLNCSDLLQEYFEDLADDAAIIAVITGSKLSDAVFGLREDGWQRTQDALQTVRAEVHKDRAGTVTLSDWAAAGTADYAYTSSGYLHASPRVTFAQRRELVNSVTLTADYRFTRRKIREHGFGWGMGKTWCQWYVNPHDLPTTDMIEQAARGAGWPISGAIFYTHHPELGLYYCNGNPVGWGGVAPDSSDPTDPAAQEEARKKIALSASWTGRKRFAQTITETYEMTVVSPASVGMFGEIVGEDGASLQTDSDDTGWEDSGNTDIPAGFAGDAIGDYIYDEDDRTESANMLECLLQLADHRIAASHRRNFVEWQVPIEPELDLAHTAQITAGRVSAKGKVAQLGHLLDLPNGRAVTTVKIACSRGGAGDQDDLTAPSAPDTSPTHGAPASATSLQTYIGGNDTVDDWVDGDYDGASYFSGNQGWITTVDVNKIYPQRVQVVGPEIEEEARQSVSASVQPVYGVAVPDDTLTVTLS
jgi:hypothetical protein